MRRKEEEEEEDEEVSEEVKDHNPTRITKGRQMMAQTE